MRSNDQNHIRTMALLGGGFPEKILMDAGAVAFFHGPAELMCRYEDWSHLVSAKLNALFCRLPGFRILRH
jgi:hypothetical protein